MFCFIFALGGCVFLTHHQQITTLENLSDNQRQMREYVSAEEKLFFKLREDVFNNRLTKGTPRGEILSQYSEPIYCKPLKDRAEIKEVCLFRHPTQYFSSDLIYLKFDENGQLYSWELKSCNK